MRTADRHLAIHNLGLLQQQAGVEPVVAELVKAYGRLLVDNGEALVFDPPSFEPGSSGDLYLRKLEQENPDTDRRFLAFLAAYSFRMNSRGYAPIVSPQNLADRLGYDLSHLRSVAGRAGRFYRERRLPRKNGGFRRIHSPREPIRSIQNWILDDILRQYRPADAAHGFVRGRSIVSNAAPHIGNSVLITLDIADFFPSIGYSRVRKAFERLGYPYSVAHLLANLCLRKGQLPQGAPTSPALSNLVCENLDARLSGLAKSRRFAYTRYADDMSFSSNEPRLNLLVPFLREIIQEEGFELRDDKTRISRGGARRMVTGVVVNERPNLVRTHVRVLRAALHRMRQGGSEAVVLNSRRPGHHDATRVLAGHLAFLKMVNPDRLL